VKWAGGKTQLLPELLKYVPKGFGAYTGFMAYHEPFVGGGALFWELAQMLPTSFASKDVILSDANVRVVVTYGAIARHVEDVIEILHRKEAAYLAADEETRSDCFYRDRRMEPSDPIARAAWFIFMNKTCFNGLCRVNKRDVFNVPHGKYKNPKICDAENLRACSRALNRGRVEILWEGFEGVEKRAAEGDLVYFDPPYVPAWKNRKTSYFTAYAVGGFSMQDQTRLRDLALRLKRRGVHVLLSNSHTPEVEEMYGHDFEMYEVEARRSVNSKGDGRGAVKEYIIR